MSFNKISRGTKRGGADLAALRTTFQESSKNMKRAEPSLVEAVENLAEERVRVEAADKKLRLASELSVKKAWEKQERLRKRQQPEAGSLSVSAVKPVKLTPNGELQTPTFSSTPSTTTNSTASIATSSDGGRSGGPNHSRSEDESSDDERAITLPAEFLLSITENPDYAKLRVYPPNCNSEKLREIYKECLTLPRREWKAKHFAMVTGMCPDLDIIKSIEQGMEETDGSPKRHRPSTDSPASNEMLQRHESVLVPRFPPFPDAVSIR